MRNYIILFFSILVLVSSCSNSSQSEANFHKEASKPIRWYSIPNLMRYEKPQRGRLREHWQFNADIFGAEDLYLRGLKLFPKDYDLAKLFKHFDNFEHLKEHALYKDNYDYNRTLLLMNLDKHLANDFVMMKEEASLSSRLATINYSFYTSRGYVIFNPDVHYRVGYPGESAYNCVIPGVTSLIEKGFIDKDNIGVQGHSWGGYQIAYLVTKTDIFKAAESGAPVPNMISAYGGIRWWTGRATLATLMAITLLLRATQKHG